MLIKLFTNNIESSKSIFNIVVGKFISLYLLTHPYIKSRFCETFVLYMNQYFIIYKPYLVASQFSPIENKETLANYFDVPKDVYPVGRLDADSEGEEGKFYVWTVAELESTLEGDFDWKEMGLSPKDMDFHRLKNMATTDIALCFGVPSQLVGVPDSQTYSNVAEARLALYEETIIPHLSKMSSDLNEWLVPLFDDRLTLEFDIDSALPPTCSRSGYRSMALASSLRYRACSQA